MPKNVAHCRIYRIPYLNTLADNSISFYITKNTISIHRRSILKHWRTPTSIHFRSYTLYWYINTLSHLLIHCRNIPYLNTWPGDPSRPWARVGCYSLSCFMEGLPAPVWWAPPSTANIDFSRSSNPVPAKLPVGLLSISQLTVVNFHKGIEYWILRFSSLHRNSDRPILPKNAVNYGFSSFFKLALFLKLRAWFLRSTPQWGTFVLWKALVSRIVDFCFLLEISHAEKTKKYFFPWFWSKLFVDFRVALHQSYRLFCLHQYLNWRFFISRQDFDAKFRTWIIELETR